MKHLNLFVISMILSVACYAQAPAPITGPTSICNGTSTAYSDVTTGGTWSSSDPVIATVGSSSGILVPVSSSPFPESVTITYTLPSSAHTALTITINPAPCAMSGSSAVCSGSTALLTDCTTGGTWTSSNTSIATFSPGGVLHAGLSGTTPIAYTVSTGCFVSEVITVSASPCAIAGPSSLCNGSSITLTDCISGGTWASSDYSIATVSSVIGVIGGYSAGTATITYTLTTGCLMTSTITVNPAPTSFTITGGGSYCSGGSGVPIGLSGSSTGVSYRLFDGATLVGAISGTGSSVSFGSFMSGSTYTVSAMSSWGCTATMTGSATIVINPLPTAYTVGWGMAPYYSVGDTGFTCAGMPMNPGLSGSNAGIIYQLYLGGSPVSSSGGKGTILDFGPRYVAGTYTVVATNPSTGCMNNMTGSSTIAFIPLPAVTVATSTVACDGSYTLSAAGAATYSWIPSTGLSCTSCSSVTCNPSAASVYSVIGTDTSGCANTAIVTVDGNRIMGTISPSVSGAVEVWLIQFNPADSSISALDSQVACTSGGSQYYNFADPASGNYMVKAYLTGGTPGASGYIPTYGTSSAHWYSATGITHSSATDNMNITMIYGTVPSGPGFISGFVASGAGRGTSVPAPSVGMLIYLTDASGNVLTYTKTDGSGNYSFGSLANGTYIIYPEDYQYNTTASSTITLSSSSESVTGIDFKQFTTSMIIIPFDYSNTGVSPVTAQQGISVFPNPAADKLNISWKNQTTGTANLVITDVLGRDVYKSAMNINATSGTAQVGLQGIKDGIYLLTIKGESINYSAKVLIED